MTRRSGRDDSVATATRRRLTRDCCTAADPVTRSRVSPSTSSAQTNGGRGLQKNIKTGTRGSRGYDAESSEAALRVGHRQLIEQHVRYVSESHDDVVVLSSNETRAKTVVRLKSSYTSTNSISTARQRDSLRRPNYAVFHRHVFFFFSAQSVGRKFFLLFDQTTESYYLHFDFRTAHSCGSRMLNFQNFFVDENQKKILKRCTRLKNEFA